LTSCLSYFLEGLDAISFKQAWLDICEVLKDRMGLVTEDLLGKQVVVLLLPLLNRPDTTLAVIARSLGVVAAVARVARLIIFITGI